MDQPLPHVLFKGSDLGRDPGRLPPGKRRPVRSVASPVARSGLSRGSKSWDPNAPKSLGVAKTGSAQNRQTHV